MDGRSDAAHSHFRVFFDKAEMVNVVAGLQGSNNAYALQSED